MKNMKKYNAYILFIIIFTLCIISKYSSSQTLQEVSTYINKSNIKHKEIVIKQAIKETGWFKCTECSLSSNNIFGFRWKGRYLEFNHWKESVDYYERWQKKHYKGGDYYQFLIDRPYATDPDYIPNLKKIKL